jgi:hypothetical protein
MSRIRMIIKMLNLNPDYALGIVMRVESSIKQTLFVSHLISGDKLYLLKKTWLSTNNF